MRHRAHRGSAGASLPKSVTATFGSDGLQVLVTGLPGPCGATPTFQVSRTDEQVRLTVQPMPADPDGCEAHHTIQLRLDDPPGHYTLEVRTPDDAVFGATELTPETR